MAENLLNMVRDINYRFKKFNKLQHKINLKRTMIRHIIATLLKTKDKEGTLTAPREKQYITYRGRMVRMNTHFLFLEATDSGITFSKCLKKERKDQLEFLIWGNIL